jgi:hypothetical protein
LYVMCIYYLYEECIYLFPWFLFFIFYGWGYEVFAFFFWLGLVQYSAFFILSFFLTFGVIMCLYVRVSE